MTSTRIIAGIAGASAAVVVGGLGINQLMQRGPTVEQVTDGLTGGHGHAGGMIEYGKFAGTRRIEGYDDKLGTTVGYDRTPFFEQADTDGDGKVSWNDVKAAVVAADRDDSGRLNRRELSDAKIIGPTVPLHELPTGDY